MLVAKMYGWFLRVLDGEPGDEGYGALDVNGASADGFGRYRHLTRDERGVEESESGELGPSVSVGELVWR